MWRRRGAVGKLLAIIPLRHVRPDVVLRIVGNRESGVEQQTTGRMQWRKMLIRGLLGFVGAILLAVVAQFFVQVAQDKGFYINAGERWDHVMSVIGTALRAVLDALTSPLATHLAFLALGVAGGLIIDWRYFRRPLDGADPLEANRAAEEDAPGEAVAGLQADISLAEVGERVERTLGPKPRGGTELTAFLIKVNTTIADAVVARKLAVWGRIGQFARKQIPGFEKPRAIFHAAKNEVAIPGELAVKTYREVMLSAKEVNQIWPPDTPASPFGNGQQAEPAPNRPLDEQERGLCLAALIELDKFLREQVEPLHQALLPAGDAPGKPDRLTRGILGHRQTAETLNRLNDALRKKHAIAFQRMGIEPKPLSKALANIDAPARGVAQAKDWPREALQERLTPLARVNGELGNALRNLEHIVTEKHKEFFGE